MELLLKQGVSSKNPPTLLQPMETNDGMTENYRKTPFVVQAACAGNLDSLQLLLQNGRDIKDVGHICLSRRRRNQVASNVIGAAAYHGHARIIKFALSRLDSRTYGNLAAMESQDTRSSKAGAFVAELEGYTPLMLAICGENANLEVVKCLLAAQVDYTCREKSTGNNILHLAARHCANFDILEYLVKNLKQEYLFERNLKGETPLTICQ